MARRVAEAIDSLIVARMTFAVGGFVDSMDSEARGANKVEIATHNVAMALDRAIKDYNKETKNDLSK